MKKKQTLCGLSSLYIRMYCMIGYLAIGFILPLMISINHLFSLDLRRYSQDYRGAPWRNNDTTGIDKYHIEKYQFMVLRASLYRCIYKNATLQKRYTIKTLPYKMLHYKNATKAKFATILQGSVFLVQRFHRVAYLQYDLFHQK